jgi:general secretion pathway protein M
MKSKITGVGVWWSKLSGREQRLMGLLVLMSLLLIVVFGLWKPLERHAQANKQGLNRERELLQVVTKQANQIESLRKKHGVDGVVREPLNQVIASSSSAFTISLIRIQPKNEQLQVWVAPLPFTRLLDWIEELDRRYGVQVVALDIERTDTSGMVDVRRLEFR